MSKILITRSPVIDYTTRRWDAVWAHTRGVESRDSRARGAVLLHRTADQVGLVWQLRAALAASPWMLDRVAARVIILLRFTSM